MWDELRCEFLNLYLTVSQNLKDWKSVAKISAELLGYNISEKPSVQKIFIEATNQITELEIIPNGEKFFDITFDKSNYKISWDEKINFNCQMKCILPFPINVLAVIMLFLCVFTFNLFFFCFVCFVICFVL